MYRFFAGKENVSDGRVLIRGTDLNHMKNVLRLRPGEEVQVLLKGEKARICRILGYSDDAAELGILPGEVPDHELPAEITLFQGLPKGDKMELIIQKAVELGADRIVPVAMKRSVAKVDPKKEEAKGRRYAAVAEAAAKQSGRDRIPETGPFMDLKGAVRFCEENGIRMLVPYELAENMEKTRETLGGLSAGERIGVFIGPEGGFDEEETALLLSAGAVTLTLGRRILRTETAGLFVLSVLSYLLEP